MTQLLATRFGRAVAIALAALAVVLALQASASLAALVAGQDIIAAPASVADDPPGATNTAQQAFDEAQGVLLTAPLAVDGGAIAAGAVVNSHMIFLNTVGGGLTIDVGVTWTFDGPVLGVMSDSGGTLEAASNALLGAAGTAYPGAFGARGMEGADGYSVAGNTITVDMHVTEPGDWIRVVTRAPAAGNCPPGWELEGTGLGNPDPKDKNGDGYVCHKDIPGNGKGNTGQGHNHKDNNQP